MDEKRGVLILILGVFLIASVYAVPQTLNIQGKLTNSTINVPLSGTYEINFSIYDAYTLGNLLWSHNYSVVADSNGIYNVLLSGVTLNFSEQYYLGVKVASDSEMTPRINLTSAPYSFRAGNISISGVEFDSNVDINNKNITTTGTGFFSFLGSLVSRITTLFVQNIDFTGNINGSGWINTTANISADYYFGDGSQLTGMSTYNATYLAGIASLNQTIIDSNNSWLSTYNSTYVTWIGSVNASALSINTTANIQNLLNATGIYSTYNTTYANYPQTLNGSLNSIAWNRTGTYTILGHTGDNVGIGTTAPSAKLDVRGQGNFSGTVYINNATDISTFVSTYNATYAPWAYNQTQPAIDILNSTYGANWYNHTIPSMAYTDVRIGLINTTANIGVLYNATATLIAGYVNTTAKQALTINTTANIQNLLNSTGIYSTYNTTYSLYNDTSLINAVNTTFNIQSLLNATGIYSTYNATYASWAYNQTQPAIDILNTTYGANWYNHTIPSMTYTNVRIGLINTTANIGILYNATASMIANLSAGQYQVITNATIASVNTTANIQNLLNATGIYSTYNATYSLRIDSVNSSFLLANTTLYNRINSVNSSLLIVNTTALSINTTANIQNLLNATGIYSTYNATYAPWAYNQTQPAINILNATYGANWYNHTIPSNAYTDVRIGLINTTANIGVLYNATATLIAGYVNTTAKQALTINTTANIQNLLNATGIYSTYNVTYAGYPQTINGTINSIAWNRTGTNVYLAKTGDKVGIGTTAPGQKLDLYDGNFRVLGVDATDNISVNSPDVIFRGKYDSNATAVGIVQAVKDWTLRNIMTWNSGAGDSRLAFLNNSGTEVLSVLENGNVGIGTTNPSQKLEVLGNVNITKNVTIGSALVFTDTSGNMIFRI